jgi:V8-like Glu-specific endopeptidase
MTIKNGGGVVGSVACARLLVAASGLAALSVGCGSDEAVGTGSVEAGAAKSAHVLMVGNPVETLASGELMRDTLIIKGREHRWRRKVQFPKAPQGAESPRADDGRTLDDFSEEELAEGLRAVVLYQGHEFVQVEPAYDAARRAKEYLRLSRSTDAADRLALQLSAKQPSLGALGGVDVSSADVVPKSVLGTDTRTVMNNLAFPHRTHTVWDNTSTGSGINGAEGTSSTIGRSTALSAAHVFWDEAANTWEPVFQWAPGYDSQDANPTPYGAWLGCYFVTIPNGYVANENHFYDFAVLDFNVPCNLGQDFIGDTTGWLGTWLASEDQIEGNTMNVRGYPAPGSCGSAGAACNVRIWGSSASGTVLSGTEIRHQVDTSEGQSGSAAYINFDPPGALGSGNYLVGIHRAGGTTYNVARLFDSTVYSLLVSASDDF